MTTADDKIVRLCVHDVLSLLNDAEHYGSSTTDQQLAYLERRADLLHRIVDATGDESSRYLACDAGDRAQDRRQRLEALAVHCGDPAPPSEVVPHRWCAGPASGPEAKAWQKMCGIRSTAELPPCTCRAQPRRSAPGN
jgi:hypothetical protein